MPRGQFISRPKGNSYKFKHAALVSTVVDQAAYEQVFEAMERDRVDGLIFNDAADHVTYRQLIVDLAAGRIQLTFHAGTGAARAFGNGRKVNAIRNAPRPMPHAPI
jgi:hypothetical protein